jgi:hypothetical protein
MDTSRILVGDHTGIIKIIDPNIRQLGSPGKHKLVLNIHTKDEVFWSVHENGLISEFDDSGQFNTLREPSGKILDAYPINNSICVIFHNGTIELDTSLLQTRQTNCHGGSILLQDLALCGTTPVELWDLERQKEKWKGWTLKPKEEVQDNKCWLKGSEIITITGNNEIFMFDIRAGKKPRRVSQLNKPGQTFFYPLQTIFNSEEFLFVGDTVGNVYKVDNDLKVLGKTKGRSTGSVLSIFEKSGILYSCGLDRRLMIHDVKTMNLLDRKYLWQKLTKVIAVD